MMAQNAPKWTAILLVAAVWSFTPAPPAATQASDAAVLPPGGSQSAVPPLRTEPSFDSSITIPELFEKAREAFGMSKFDLAQEFYQEILIRERSNVQAMLELANVYERTGRLEYARGLLLRSAKLAPDNSDIADRLAAVEHMLTIVLSAEVDSLLSAQEYELAIPKLSVHLSIEPDNPDLLFKRALCYSHLGRPDAALSSIDRAIQIDPKEKYYKLRSSLLEDLKNMETSERVAEAKGLIQSGDVEDRRRALEVLGEILQSDPENAWARAEFVRLSSQGETRTDTTSTAAESVLTAVARAGHRASELLQRHLSTLLLLIVAWIVFRSPLTKLVTKWLLPRAFLSGRFPKFTLTEILVMLNSESHTGVLHVKGEACRGRIYIEKGEPCHCVVGRLEGAIALHHLLSNTRNGHFEFADGSIPLNRTIDTPLSIVLVDHKRGGPGRSASHQARAEARAKKPKSRMKELLESKSRK
jgi:tetratricopeptide (TPR) repeat protein